MTFVEEIEEMADEDAKAEAEAKADAQLTKYKKSRVWAGILYPDSLPDNWNEYLLESGLACALSPLHDRDVKSDGTPKKPHYHFLMCWDGPTTYQNARQITKSVLHGTLPIPIISPRGYYRYFTHMDSPNKVQYDAQDIMHYNGFDPRDFLALTKSEVTEVKKKLVTLILDLDMYDYAEFIEYIMFNGGADEFDVATSHTVFFNAYLNSRWKRMRSEQEAAVRSRSKVALSRDTTLTGEAGQAALDNADETATP